MIIDGTPGVNKTSAMQHYRLYRLGPAGRIIAAQDLQCPDDRDALAQADREREHHNVELWQDIRLLARLRKLTVH